MLKSNKIISCLIILVGLTCTFGGVYANTIHAKAKGAFTEQIKKIVLTIENDTNKSIPYFYSYYSKNLDPSDVTDSLSTGQKKYIFNVKYLDYQAAMNLSGATSSSSNDFEVDFDAYYPGVICRSEVSSKLEINLCSAFVMDNRMNIFVVIKNKN